MEEDSSDGSSDEEAAPKPPLLTDLDRSEKKPGGLSRRAAQFFDQDIFKDIGGIPEVELESENDLEDGEEEISADLDKLGSMVPIDEEEESDYDLPTVPDNLDSEESGDEDGFEVVKRSEAEKQWEEEPRDKDGKIGKLHPLTYP